ncbi:MAG: hypothetical protein QXI54_01430 [Archaeoglobaceae archaeon]
MAKREAKKIITVEEVIAIHNKLIKKYGGEKGILNYGVLDFAVSWVKRRGYKIPNRTCG